MASNDLREALAPVIERKGVPETAAAANISEITLTQWLAGERNLTDRHVDALALACGVEIVFERQTEPDEGACRYREMCLDELQEAFRYARSNPRACLWVLIMELSLPCAEMDKSRFRYWAVRTYAHARLASHLIRARHADALDLGRRITLLTFINAVVRQCRPREFAAIADLAPGISVDTMPDEFEAAWQLHGVALDEAGAGAPTATRRIRFTREEVERVQGLIERHNTDKYESLKRKGLNMRRQVFYAIRRHLGSRNHGNSSQPG